MMAARAGIHVEKAKGGVPHHAKDMRMTAYKQIRLIPQQVFFCSCIVVAGIAADMGHVDTNSLATPLKLTWNLGPNVGSIYVTEHSAYRLEVTQRSEHVKRAEVAGMPDFVTRREVREHGLIQKTMRV
jgi:hypothetical protein